jgi:hypothetical protein
VSPETYAAAASFARPWLDRLRPVPERAGAAHRCPNRKAIYIVCDYTGAVAYVGSTCRGVALRLSEHMAHDKSRGWSEVWTIPLLDTTPPKRVRHVEGLIGRYLTPTSSRALPAI